MIKPIDAQTIPKPSVPEFNLKYADNTDNQSIEVIIYDQLPAHYEVDNQTAWLWYNIQWKNHSDNTWHVYSQDYAYNGNQLISASNSYVSSEPVSNDSIHFNTFTTNVTYFIGYSYNGLTIDNFSVGQKIDFQVKAIFGYYFIANYKINLWEFNGNESAWSPTQTITIPTSTNPSPTVPEFPITISLVVVLVAVSLLSIIGKRKLTIINH
jgi:hypothetical protein